MDNFCLEIEYQGTNYYGFQIQEKKDKSEITIQAVIEQVLYRLFRRKIRIIYSGRTDRGVHAKGQVLNFKVDTKIKLDKIKSALNSFLPCDIRIRKIKKVPLDFHSRFWAKSKKYQYLILNKKEPSVFWHNLSWHISDDLNLKLMEKAVTKITGKKDFSLFAKEAKKYKDCIREVKAIKIRKKGSVIYIDIKASGFLRFMARNIVSFLVKTGKKEIPLKDINFILNKKIKYTNKPAPAQGLYLYKVNY